LALGLKTTPATASRWAAIRVRLYRSSIGWLIGPINASMVDSADRARYFRQQEQAEDARGKSKRRIVNLRHQISNDSISPSGG
jgi:hypothetical protein